MNIAKAIQINQSLLDGTYDHRDEAMQQALKLGIEALKGRQQMIACGWKLLPPLLPGETKQYIPPNIGTLPSDQDYDNEVSK